MPSVPTRLPLPATLKGHIFTLVVEIWEDSTAVNFNAIFFAPLVNKDPIGCWGDRGLKIADKLQLSGFRRNWEGGTGWVEWELEDEGCTRAAFCEREGKTKKRWFRGTEETAEMFFLRCLALFYEACAIYPFSLSFFLSFSIFFFRDFNFFCWLLSVSLGLVFYGETRQPVFRSVTCWP